MITQIEGTWEEIAAHAAELTGKRLRLTILSGDTDASEAIPWSPNQALVDAIRNAELAQRGMNPRPGKSGQAYVREARAGGMYGCEPDG